MTKPIKVNRRIGQLYSLCLIQFNLIMNELFKLVRDKEGYPSRNKNINIIGYPDNFEVQQKRRNQ